MGIDESKRKELLRVNYLDVLRQLNAAGINSDVLLQQSPEDLVQMLFGLSLNSLDEEVANQLRRAIGLARVRLACR